MIHEHPSYSEPEALKFLFQWPLRILFTVFIVTLPFNSFTSEVFLWLTTGLTVAYMLTQIFVGHRKARIFRIGGEVSLFVFLLTVFLSWNLNNRFELTHLFHIRWFFILYIVTYLFDLIPTINSRIHLLVTTLAISGIGGLIAAFAPNLHSQLFSLSIITKNPGQFTDWIPASASGSTGSPLEFGLLMCMALSFTLAGLLFHKRLTSGGRFCLVVFSCILIIASALTFNHVVYLTVILVFAAHFLMKRQGLMLVLSVVSCGLIYYFGSKAPIANPFPQHDREQLQRVVDQFKNNFVIGNGFSIETGSLLQTVPAKNMYFQLLAGTGVIGFLAFMGFALQFLFITLRLWQEVPPTHFWHRTFLMGAFSSQLVFYFCGLYIWPFANYSLTALFVLSLAIVAILSERYGRTIVSDDYSI